MATAPQPSRIDIRTTIEAVHSVAATTATTVEVIMRAAGGGASTQGASKRLVITAADMECGGAGDYHLFIATSASDATPADITTVVRSLTGSTAVASLSDHLYFAIDTGDGLYIKTPASGSVQIRVFGYVV